VGNIAKMNGAMSLVRNAVEAVEIRATAAGNSWQFRGFA
jgi:hypothetical protein